MNISDIMLATAKGRPTRVLMHSQEGWGKTWLAAHFPNTVWIAPEDGFPRDLPMQPHIIPVRKWLDMFAAVDMLITQPHNFLTLVIDTVDWIEPLLHAFVLARDSGRETEMNKKGRILESIEDYGYGKGYIAADEEWRRFVEKLKELQARRNMHIVFLAHSQVKKFNNPQGEDFDRWQPKMHERITRVCVEWCETVLFGFYDLAAGKIGDEKRAKGISEGKRLVGLRYSAMYDAKNRLGLPPVVEMTDTGAFVGYLLGQHMPHASADVEPVAPPTNVAPYANEKQADAVRAANDRDPTDTGRMLSAAEHRAAREQQQERQKPEPIVDMRPGPLEHAQGVVRVSQSNADTPAQAEARMFNDPPKPHHRPKEPDIDAKLLADLTRAQSMANAKDAAFGANVATWCKQANGDHNKLRSIINHVEQQCGGAA